MINGQWLISQWVDRSEAQMTPKALLVNLKMWKFENAMCWAACTEPVEVSGSETVDLKT